MQWLSANLYVHAPVEQVLVTVVQPFVRQALASQAASQYFFIRYTDEQGLHIRLRMLTPQLLSLRNQLMLHLEPQASLVPALAWTEYEPETERYGGTNALKIAENQFQASSDMSLAVLQSYGEDWNQQAALATAMHVYLAHAFAFGMNMQQLTDFFRAQYHAYHREVQANYADLAKQQVPQFLGPIKQFLLALVRQTNFDDAWLNDWVEACHQNHDALVSLRQTGEVLSRPDNNILESYLHMSANRLGLNHRYEPYLAYLLWQICAEIQQA
jgi:thiopeptide-type bacteriocin biosynthesis protein